MAAHQNHIWKFGEKNNTWALVFRILESEWRLFYEMVIVIISVQFSRSIVSNSLWPHGLQHARLPCPSPSPRVCPSSCPLSQWCLPTISSSVVPFSSSIFPSIGVFSSELDLCISWPEYWSFSFSISPSNDWFDLLAVPGTLKSLLQHHSLKASVIPLSTFSAP